MREMLFRGKLKHDINPRKPAGSWVYGGYYFWKNGACIHEDNSCVGLFVDPETVGQYIGDRDKNDRQIFEGDIVKDQFGNVGVVIYSDLFLDWRVSFHKGRDDLTRVKALGVRIFDWTYPKMSLEVIGDVHDDPELLKGGEA